MTEQKRKKILDTVKEWTVINLGTLLLAIGVYFFKGPNNFATGGVSGLAIILDRFIPVLGQPELNLIMNVLLLIIGFIFLGKGCTFKTAYCSVVYSGEMWLMKFIPLKLPMTDQIFLEFILAMLLTGIGSALMFNCHASSGGTDIIALIVKKYTKANIGTAMLFTDIAIATSTFFIFGITTGLYSILGLFSKSFLVDGVIENIGKSKYITIITSHPDKISPFILEKIHRSYTSFKAHGGYTGEEKHIMLTVCKRGEAFRLKAQIHTVDPEAFVILTDTNEILGKGFRDSL